MASTETIFHSNLPNRCATKPYHLDEAVAAVSVQLTPDEINHLEEAYQPHPVLGHV